MPFSRVPLRRQRSGFLPDRPPPPPRRAVVGHAAPGFTYHNTVNTRLDNVRVRSRVAYLCPLRRAVAHRGVSGQVCHPLKSSSVFSTNCSNRRRKRESSGSRPTVPSMYVLRVYAVNYSSPSRRQRGSVSSGGNAGQRRQGCTARVPTQDGLHLLDVLVPTL